MRTHRGKELARVSEAEVTLGTDLAGMEQFLVCIAPSSTGHRKICT